MNYDILRYDAMPENKIGIVRSGLLNEVEVINFSPQFCHFPFVMRRARLTVQGQGRQS